MKWFKELGESIFGYGSPVTMGVVRIFVGTLAFINFLMIAVDFDAWFTERGFTPYEFSERHAGGLFRINLLGANTDTTIVAIFYGLVVLAAAFTALGLWTRVSSILLFLGIVTLHHRVPDILHSGDTLLRVFAFYVMIAPSGKAVSLDRLIGLRKGTAPPQLEEVSLWPQRLMQFQVSIVYFTTFWHKMQGTMWRDGTAAYYPLQLREFDRFPVPSFLETQPFIAIQTYGTLLVELGIAFLAYNKVARKYVLLGGVILHAGIEYSLNIPLFALVMVSTYMSFYYGEEVADWFRRLGRRLSRFALIVRLPAGRRFTPHGEALVKGMDPLGLVTYEPGDDTSWRASKPDGEPVKCPVKGSHKRSAGAWVLAPIPGLYRRWFKQSVESIGSPEAEGKASGS